MGAKSRMYLWGRLCVLYLFARQVELPQASHVSAVVSLVCRALLVPFPYWKKKSKSHNFTFTGGVNIPSSCVCVKASSTVEPKRCWLSSLVQGRLRVYVIAGQPLKNAVTVRALWMMSLRFRWTEWKVTKKGRRRTVVLDSKFDGDYPRGPHGLTFTWRACCGLCLWHMSLT